MPVLEQATPSPELIAEIQVIGSAVGVAALGAVEGRDPFRTNSRPMGDPDPRHNDSERYNGSEPGRRRNSGDQYDINAASQTGGGSAGNSGDKGGGNQTNDQSQRHGGSPQGNEPKK